MTGDVADVPAIIASKGGLKYAGLDVDAMRAVVKAYQDRSLQEFQATLQVGVGRAGRASDLGSGPPFPPRLPARPQPPGSAEQTPGRAPIATAEPPPHLSLPFHTFAVLLCPAHRRPHRARPPVGAVRHAAGAEPHSVSGTRLCRHSKGSSVYCTHYC